MKYKLLMPALILPIYWMSCTEATPSIETKLVKNASSMNAAVKVQMTELLRLETDTANQTQLKLYNPKSIAFLMEKEYEPIFTEKKSYTQTAKFLKTFIDSNCKYYGLFPKAYHQETLNELESKLSNVDSIADNAEQWAKAELYMTDAWFQLVKHVKNGRLYKDTNNVFLDTALTQIALIPSINLLKEDAENIDQILHGFEPKFADYDSLKFFLKGVLNSTTGKQIVYTKLQYPTKDSVAFVKQFIKRINEEGAGINEETSIDSLQLVSIIKNYQQKNSQKETGVFSSALIDNLNMNSESKISKIALSLDKFKQLKIPNKGAYVLVNIPSYMLRAYNQNTEVAVESKVVVGRVTSKTPIMESEISNIIVMPRWYVPPSILKLPGYIDRKRRNPNYIVHGKTVIQKSGPGNALGKMKFHFKSGDAIYLHDTNEKWAFGSSKRAASHGCVRVQSYEALAKFLNSITPLVEKNYVKVKDKMKVDSVRNDTSYTYKYVVKDSIVHKNDAVISMLQKQSHHELELEQKIPVYISYMTCAVRNGLLISYNDVYGYDANLQKKYLEPYM